MVSTRVPTIVARDEAGMESTKQRRTVHSWSSLSDDLLCLIADKIDLVEDYVTFCAVSRGWYASGSDFYNRKKKSDFKTPFYMFGIDPHHDPNPSLSRCIFSREIKPSPNLTIRSIVSGRNFKLSLPEAAGRRFWGSQFGWLVTYGAVDRQFSLLNPFTRATVSLPSMDSLFPNFHYEPPHWFIKAFLTADPATDDCLVLVVVKSNMPREKYRLALAKPGGGKTWTRISDRQDGLSDVVSFKGKLYGVSASCYQTVNVYLIQIQPRPLVVEVVNTKLIPGDPTLGLAGSDLEADFQVPGGRYFCLARKPLVKLVELNGELCLILRHIVDSTSTGYFKAFNIDLSTGKLTRVWPLGDHCLFLGNNNTFTCKATSFPPEAFQQLEDPPADFMSNHVFYTLRAKKVYGSSQTRTRYPPLWMIPSISFSYKFPNT